MTNDGLAKILDFGIARAGNQRMTKTGLVLGTVFYMPPEQVNGQALGITGTSISPTPPTISFVS